MQPRDPLRAPITVLIVGLAGSALMHLAWAAILYAAVHSDGTSIGMYIKLVGIGGLCVDATLGTSALMIATKKRAGAALASIAALGLALDILFDLGFLAWAALAETSEHLYQLLSGAAGMVDAAAIAILALALVALGRTRMRKLEWAAYPIVALSVVGFGSSALRTVSIYTPTVLTVVVWVANAIARVALAALAWRIVSQKSLSDPTLERNMYR